MLDYSEDVVVSGNEFSIDPAFHVVQEVVLHLDDEIVCQFLLREGKDFEVDLVTVYEEVLQQLLFQVLL